MTKEQAVALSHVVSKLHEQWGGSVVCLDGASAYDRFEDLELLQWGEPLEVDGDKVLPKQHVRALLWERRKVLAQLGLRPTAVVWSAYDPEVGRSAIGLGVMVEPSARLRERYLISE